MQGMMGVSMAYDIEMRLIMDKICEWLDYTYAGSKDNKSQYS